MKKRYHSVTLVDRLHSVTVSDTRMRKEREAATQKKIELCINMRRKAASFPRTPQNQKTINSLNQWEENWRKVHDFDFTADVPSDIALRMLCEWLVQEGSIKLGTPQSALLIKTTKKTGAWR